VRGFVLYRRKKVKRKGMYNGMAWSSGGRLYLERWVKVEVIWMEKDSIKKFKLI
jgi:hypothetical protein